MESSYLNEQRKKQRMIQLTEAGALIAMPFIGGRNSRAGQVRLVNEFMAMRAELAAQHVADWSESRRKVSTSFKMVCDTLKEVRADKGKTTLPHHYGNESRLINFVLFGRFESVNRDGTVQADIDLLDKVEARDAFLIARGHTYDERKVTLPVYLQSLLAKPERIVRTNWQPGSRPKTENVFGNKVAMLEHAPVRTKHLTLLGPVCNAECKCLKSRLQSGMSPRQSVAFFTPIVSSMGKGEAVRNGGLLGSVRDFNTLTPPLTLEIVSGGFQSHRGAHHA